MTTPNPKPRRRPRSKISKMLTDRIKGTRALASSIKKWKGRVAEGVGERLLPALRDGETLPDQALRALGPAVSGWPRRLRVDISAAGRWPR